METDWVDPAVEVGNWYFERLLLGTCAALPQEAEGLLSGVRPVDFGTPVLRDVCAAVQAGNGDPFSLAARFDPTLVADLLASAATPGVALAARGRVLEDSFRRSAREHGTRLAQTAEGDVAMADLLQAIRSSVEALRAEAVRCGVGS